MLKRGMKPSHPGALLKETLEGLVEETGKKISIGELAEGLGISRKTISAILNERQGISPEMALRLSIGFGSSPQFWLNVQRNYDLWQAETHLSVSSIRRFWQPVAG